MNTLELIQRNIDTFSKSERKVAEVILELPQEVIHSSIAKLAVLANVSEPTVNRFCRRLNTKGYPDFKLKLAQSLANGIPYVNRNINPDDTPKTYTEKIFESTTACLDIAKNALNTNDVNHAVDMLTKAHRISFFGLGSSSIAAHDALNKFFRFNIPIFCFDDIVMQKMSCINSSEGDVFVLISHTGRTKALVEVAELARKHNASVIALTAKESPLAAESDLVLSMGVPEDTDLYMPMASRIAQLVLIDILTTGFTLKRGEKCQENLKRVKESIRNSRYDKFNINRVYERG